MKIGDKFFGAESFMVEIAVFRKLRGDRPLARQALEAAARGIAKAAPAERNTAVAVGTFGVREGNRELVDFFAVGFF